MARKAKIDNAILKRFSREEKARPVEIRDKRRYFLIVCEGEKTEPHYFEALSNDLPPGVLALYNFEIDGTGLNTESLIDYTIIKKNSSSFKYDEVWAVFDRDSFTPTQFNNAIIKAATNDIKTAWSNEAFELWYVLHFVYNDAAISRDQYRPIINRELSIRIGKVFSYQKNNPEMYKLLKKYGNHQLAIRYASKLQKLWSNQNFASHNPSTMVHNLVKKLCSLSLDKYCKSDKL